MEAHKNKTTWIRSKDPSLLQNVREAVESWELLLVLVRRQISVRYAQTLFGAAWIVLQPILTAALYTMVFGLFVKIQTGGIPYPLFSYCGMVLWLVFAQGIERGSVALVQDERLITKVYFPRVLLPVSSVLSVLVDFAVAGFVLVGVAWIWGFPPSTGMLLFPIAVVPAVLAAIGISALLSSLNIRWRDLRQVAPFLVQIWVWATPVAYPVEIAPAPWSTLVLLNPITPPVMLFRHAILGSAMPPLWSLGVSFAVSFLLFLVGMKVFAKVEKSFADYI